MKRIDEKIQEIEKKDKRSRGLYIAFVVLIIGFMGAVLYFQSQLAEKDALISNAQIENSSLYKNLAKQKEASDSLFKELSNSLKPEQYWSHIETENSVESYIEYLTNIWGIRRDSTDIETAMSNIKLENTKGESGWLYVGTERNDGVYRQPNNGQVVEIVWRRGQEEDIESIEKSKPQKNDIIKLVTSINRKTRSRADSNGSVNEEGWRPSSRAYVFDTKKNQAEVWVKIRYY